MSTVTVTLSGIEMDESEYLCTLSHSKRFEFTNGVVTAKRGPYMTQSAHVAIAEELSAAFREASKRVGGFGGQAPTLDLGSAGERIYRIPDYAYWAPGRERGRGIFAPPTLAVEIVSPDQSVADLREKCRLYLAHGVDVCWLINPDQRWAEVFDQAHDGSRVEPDGALETALVPGLSIPLQSLWNAVEAVSE
jgi:Uma2 family endonuclease